MSRIHDALKRAEQERASSLGTHVEPSFEQQPDIPSPEMPPLQGARRTGSPSPSDFSYETLLARCPQTTWHPDPVTMLFFDDDERRAGAEEFRDRRPGSPSPSDFSYETLLARCPQTTWHPDPVTMLFFDDDERRAGAEEFRTLRSRLYQIREKMPLKRLLITSALPKEGKSFVAANLGQ